MNQPIRLTPKKERGIVLVLVLWIAMILAIISISLAYEMRTNLQLTSQTQKRFHARALARRGLAEAVRDIQNDQVLKIANPAQARSDTYLDTWGPTEDMMEGIELDDGKIYSYEVHDDQGKLNLNHLNALNAPILGYLIAELADIDEVDADEMALMIVDYQDPDSIPSSGVGEDETQAWTDWAFSNYGDDLPEDWEFRPRNDALMTVEELLEIPGITRSLLYGPDDDFESSRQRKRKRRRSRRDFELPSERESLALKDYVTVQSNPTININTAPELLIEAIIVAALGAQGEGVADKFVNFRDSQMRDSDERGILNPQQAFQEAGIPPNEFGRIRQLAQLSIDTRHFTIYAKGIYRGVKVEIVARVFLDPAAFPVDESDPIGRGLKDEALRAKIRTRQQHIINPAVRVRELHEI